MNAGPEAASGRAPTRRLVLGLLGSAAVAALAIRGLTSRALGRLRGRKLVHVGGAGGPAITVVPFDDTRIGPGDRLAG